jgi:glycosyltransferase involved in cell wall biosynthesis
MMAKRFLIWYWSASGGGGSQIAVNLAHRLSLRFGADAIRLSLHADDPLCERAESLAFETLRARVTTQRRDPLATATALPASARVLAEHARGVDCVIIPMNFAAAAPLSVSLRQPLVYAAHDPEPHPGDYAPVAQRLTQDWLMQRSARVLVFSAYAAERLASRSRALAAKLQMAPLSAAFPPAHDVRPQADAPVRLLFAGRMIAYKGVELLAEALKLIGADGWRLVVAGEGPSLTETVARELGARGADIRRGWMQEAELDALIGACDVFLAPYLSATQSGVISQALAHGKPCVVTPVGALGEQIGDGAAGWVAPSATPEAYAAAITAALASAAARRGKAEAAANIARQAWEGDHWRWLEAL